MSSILCGADAEGNVMTNKDQTAQRIAEIHSWSRGDNLAFAEAGDVPTVRDTVR